MIKLLKRLVIAMIVLLVLFVLFMGTAFGIIIEGLAQHNG